MTETSVPVERHSARRTIWNTSATHDRVLKGVSGADLNPESKSFPLNRPDLGLLVDTRERGLSPTVPPESRAPDIAA
jgi:hypothetical protein